ncbi:DUF5103 domain-containing protein [Gillisia sp. M10.2A]|uniref:DUF5103 domain-containing protein n=1 Tax=Gillisia lutea TaxID=2909668 RepID=A0ABS9EJ61_9FLAO|nr:DUF5103 domain-containing protein [Gillisia lutea]MCF4102382.1 DUF5103 domain-containing protein [Gillisia lutea]
MRILTILAVVLCSTSVFSQQQQETPPPNFIRSITFQGDAKVSGNPIIRIEESLLLEFDDIIGDEADYYYTIEHFNFDWTPSQLNKSEYLDGFDEVRITDFENSYNTLQAYTHYKLSFPNKDTKGFKVSGNYLLKVFNTAKEIIFSRKFMVYQPIAQVAVTIKRSRDLSFINKKQVVNFTVNSPELLLKNPATTVKTLILKNNNLKTAISQVPPQYTIGNELIFKYDKETSFWAGNEYLQFDSKDVRAPTINISRIELLDLYHHYLFTDTSRDTEPYRYNPDINGQFIVRTLQGENSAIESEYIWTHFTLQNFDPLNGGQLHLYGAFNNFEINDTTLMTYNTHTGLYENAMLLKQGFYNYSYVLVKKDGTLNEGFISGNFDKTENKYQVLIYYRDLGARYDQIIGFGEASSINITN